MDVRDPNTPRDWDESVGAGLAVGASWQHWAHHGVAVLADGSIVVPGPDGELLRFARGGTLIDRIVVDTSEIHGITVVTDDAVDGPPRERLWLADCGFAMSRSDEGDYEPATRGSHGPRALLVELDGSEVMSIGVPDCACYRDNLFLPTSVAVDKPTVDEPGVSGTGDVWIADGYGLGVVMRFSPMGTLEALIDGTDDGSAVPDASPDSGGAGRFDCPHAIFIDRRRSEPELLVADRGNARVQVFGLDGRFRRSFGEGVLTSPSAFATVGDHLVIAELRARVVVLDLDDTLVVELGADEAVTERPGWPNALDADGHPIRPTLHAGRFNSPHGLAVDGAGRLLVSEWLIGGRLVSLPPTAT